MLMLWPVGGGTARDDFQQALVVDGDYNFLFGPIMSQRDYDAALAEISRMSPRPPRLSPVVCHNERWNGVIAVRSARHIIVRRVECP